MDRQTTAKADTCPGRQLPSVFYSYLGSLVRNVVLRAVVALRQLSYLVSCLTWTVVVPGQLSYLGSCLPGQLSPGQLSAWAVVAWAVVGAS